MLSKSDRIYKVFWVFPQPLCERFCGGGRKLSDINLLKIWHFFSPPEICGKLSQNFFSMKSAVKIFFNEISSGNFFRFFFNEISSGIFFSIFFQWNKQWKFFSILFSMKSAVEIFFDFFSMKSAVEIFFDFFFNEITSGIFFQVFFVQNHWRQKILPPMPQPTLVIFLSLLYLLSNVKDKSHVTFGGRG